MRIVIGTVFACITNSFRVHQIFSKENDVKEVIANNVRSSFLISNNLEWISYCFLLFSC